jgi:hypothetical protein
LYGHSHKDTAQSPPPIRPAGETVFLLEMSYVDDCKIDVNEKRTGAEEKNAQCPQHNIVNRAHDGHYATWSTCTQQQNDRTVTSENRRI